MTSELSVRVTGDAAAFVSAEVSAGRYPDAEQLVAEALAWFEEDMRDQPRTEEAFDRLMDERIAAMEAGDYEEVAVDQLEQWMKRVVAEAAP